MTKLVEYCKSLHWSGNCQNLLISGCGLISLIITTGDWGQADSDPEIHVVHAAPSERIERNITMRWPCREGGQGSRRTGSWRGTSWTLNTECQLNIFILQYIGNTDLQVPCWGRGCKEDFPCEREEEIRGDQCIGMEREETHHGSRIKRYSLEQCYLFPKESVLTVNLKLTPSLRSERHKAKAGNIFFKKLNKSLIFVQCGIDKCV